MARASHPSSKRTDFNERDMKGSMNACEEAILSCLAGANLAASSARRRPASRRSGVGKEPLACRTRSCCPIMSGRWAGTAGKEELTRSRMLTENKDSIYERMTRPAGHCPVLIVEDDADLREMMAQL